jgi:hypothetical protein
MLENDAFTHQPFQKEALMAKVLLLCHVAYEGDGKRVYTLMDDGDLLENLETASPDLVLHCSFPLKWERFEASSDKSAKQKFVEYYEHCKCGLPETATMHIFLAFDCGSGKGLELNDIKDGFTTKVGDFVVYFVNGRDFKSLKNSSLRPGSGSICIPLQFEQFNERKKPWTFAERVATLTSLEKNLLHKGLSQDFQEKFKRCLKHPRGSSIIFKSIHEIAVIDTCSWEELEPKEVSQLFLPPSRNVSLSSLSHGP